MPLPQTRSISSICDRIVDIGLASVICVVPFVMGGRTAWGQFTICLIAFLTALAWAVRQMVAVPNRDSEKGAWELTGIEWVWLAGAGLALLQLFPLPGGLLGILSPKIPDILGSYPGGSWSRLSLTPHDTADGLAIFLAYAMIFGVATQRIRQTEDIESILRLVAVGSGLMAIFGVVQFFFGNGKFFWFYENPFTDTQQRVKGSFSNKNHFAQFLAIGIGPLLWCVWSISHSRKQNPRGSGDFLAGLAFIGLVGVVFAGLLSLSRGGAIAIAAASLAAIVMFLRARLFNRTMLAAVTGGGVLLAGFLLIYGMKHVSGRLDDFFAADIETLDQSAGRRSIWAANLSGIRDFPLVGAGIGSHREVYPMYLEVPIDREFTHAENGYLQLGLETGILGLGLMLIGIVLCARWIVQGLRAVHDPRLMAASAAIGASIMANVVHSGTDFVWYVPGIMGVLAILAACAWRISLLALPAPRPIFRSFAAPWLSGGFAFAGLFGIWQLAPGLLSESHWNSYLKISLDESQESDSEKISSERETEMIQELQAILKVDSAHARAHLRLARLYLMQFTNLQAHAENQMTLEQIRDAALAARFESKEALMEWLNRAVGKPVKLLEAALVHTQKSIALCPMSGDAYLYLSRLSFLNLPETDQVQAMLTQALRVRPHDGTLLFAAGKDSLTRGEVAEAMAYWKKAVHCGQSTQTKVYGLLAGRIPVQKILEEFNPDRPALGHLVERYRLLNKPEEMALLINKYSLATAEYAKELTGEEAVKTWREVHILRQMLGDMKGATKALQNAVKVAPNDFDAQYALGLWLYQQKQFKSAAHYLKWCAERRPNNKGLKKLADAAEEGVEQANYQDQGIRR